MNSLSTIDIRSYILWAYAKCLVVGIGGGGGEIRKAIKEDRSKGDCWKNKLLDMAWMLTRPCWTSLYLCWVWEWSTHPQSDSELSSSFNILITSSAYSWPQLHGKLFTIFYRELLYHFCTINIYMYNVLLLSLFCNILVLTFQICLYFIHTKLCFYIIRFPRSWVNFLIHYQALFPQNEIWRC